MSPPVGNQPVFTAKINNNNAKKNDGIAIPILDSMVKILSIGFRQCKAATIPSGIPTAQVKNITKPVNKRVFGILSINLSATFSPVVQ